MISFSGRITRRIVPSMLLLMSFISSLIYLFAQKEITDLTSVHYQDILETTNDKVEGMLDKVEVSAVNNLAEIQESLETPEEVLHALEKELMLNPHIVGYGVGFNPDYYPEKGHWFEPYVARRDNGQIERLQIGSEQHDYLNAKWFRETLEIGKGQCRILIMTKREQRPFCAPSLHLSSITKATPLAYSGPTFPCNGFTKNRLG